MTEAHVPEGEVTTYVDSNEQQIAEIDYDRRYIELGGYNHAGEAAVVILRDGHGREVMRFSAESGNVIIGGLNPERGQDGDVILKDKLGRQTIRLSAAGATVDVGDENVDGELNVNDRGGAAVITLDGEARTVAAGGSGTAGRLMAKNAGGRVTAGLDGEQNALMLRSPDGTVYAITVANDGSLTTRAL